MMEQRAVIVEHTIQDIITDIEQQKKTDILAEPVTISAFGHDNRVEIGVCGDDTEYRVNDHALQQMEAAMMPGFSTYGRNLRSAGMLNEYVDNFNALMPRLTSARMIRTNETEDGPEVRAFLSSKYERIDDDKVFGCVIDAISDNQKFVDDFKTIGGCRTGLHTYMKMVSRNPIFELNIEGKKREFSFGIIFSNSEVGLGCCQMQILMIDRYCNNGCIFSSTEIGSFRRVHSGRQLFGTFGLGELPAPSVDNQKLLSLRDDIKLAIDAACDRELFGGFYQAIQASVDINIDTDSDTGIDRYAEVIGKHLGLTKAEQQAVAGRLIDTGDRTLFGVQAAITDAAKYASSYERKIELENAGAKVFTDVTSRWKTIKALAENQ